MAKQSTKVDVKKSEGKERSLATPSLFGAGEPFFRLRGDLDRVFEDFMKGWPHFGAFDMGLPTAFTASTVSPSVDVSETDKQYEITVELPGMDESDVEVTLQDDLLTISGEKKTEREEKKKDYYLSERSYGSFKRSFRLPPEVDAEKVKAAMEKGVMSLTLPKLPAAKSSRKKISISAKK